MNASIVLAVALVAALPALAPAQMYKWVDEKGVTHYSETPPPSGKGQTVPIKPRASPAPEPPQARPAAPAKAGAPPAPGPTKGPPAEAPGDADLRRLTGDWKTAEGQAVRLSMTIQPFGDSVKIAFVRTDGGKLQINNRPSYDFAGGNGQGRFSVTFQPADDWDARMTPTHIDYRLRGDVLEASITASVFAGSYTLRQ